MAYYDPAKEDREYYQYDVDPNPGQVGGAENQILGMDLPVFIGVLSGVIVCIISLIMMMFFLVSRGNRSNDLSYLGPTFGGPTPIKYQPTQNRPNYGLTMLPAPRVSPSQIL